MKRLIIGLGTGRCGTTSLSYFLNSQIDIEVLHEGRIDGKLHIFKWENDRDRILNWLEFLEKRAGSNQYFGDIGMYFLSHVPFIIEKFSNAKFICLKRDREKVVQSYLRNHWDEHDINSEEGAMWDAAYPKFDEPDKTKALELYWDMYYQEIDRLKSKYPQQISCFDTESLNTKMGRNEILEFIEYRQKRKLDGVYQKNKYLHPSLKKMLKTKNYILEWVILVGRRTLPVSARHWLWENIGCNLF